MVDFSQLFSANNMRALGDMAQVLGETGDWGQAMGAAGSANWRRKRLGQAAGKLGGEQMSIVDQVRQALVDNDPNDLVGPPEDTNTLNKLTVDGKGTTMQIPRQGGFTPVKQQLAAMGGKQDGVMAKPEVQGPAGQLDQMDTPRTPALPTPPSATTQPSVPNPQPLQAMRSFKPLQALTAEDYDGLDPADIHSLLNVQTMGNQQQQQMFRTAMQGIQWQQSRIDNARTESERQQHEIQLAGYKSELRQVEEMVNYGYNVLLDNAKTGNQQSLEQARAMLRQKQTMLEEGLPSTQASIEYKTAMAEKLRMEAEALAAGEQGGMTAAQQANHNMKMKDWLQTSKLNVLKEDVPFETKQMLAREVNAEPMSDSYMLVEQEPGRLWGTNEVVREVPLPYNPAIGRRMTMGDVMKRVQEANDKLAAMGQPPMTPKEYVMMITDGGQQGPAMRPVPGVQQ